MAAKTSTQSVETQKVQTGIDTLNKTIITVLGTFSLMIGLWGGACIVNAMVSNGLVEIAKGWITAVFGM